MKINKACFLHINQFRIIMININNKLIKQIKIKLQTKKIKNKKIQNCLNNKNLEKIELQ